MPAISATAPGKTILFGEHAVVYGRPAIAAPVTQIRAKATVFAEIRGQPGDVLLDAPDIGLKTMLSHLTGDHALAQACHLLARELNIARFPALRLHITSTIPIAAGLGSGAAISIAALRALSAFLGQPLPTERINALAFELEKIHHGTPSGIDNTVIAYAQPIFFVRDQPFELLRVARPISLIIADTGIRSPTSVAVAGLRERRQLDPARYESWFDQIAAIAKQARAAIESGRLPELGALMNANHALLRQLGVSSPELDQLVSAASQAGAWGAKLSGGGQGGNCIAIAGPDQIESIAQALQTAGAVRTWIARIDPAPTDGTHLS
jgi:mevalonate kinase